MRRRSLLLVSFSVGCRAAPTADSEPFAVVLGIAQDAGFPKAACAKACCEAAWKDPSLRRFANLLRDEDDATDHRVAYEIESALVTAGDDYSLSATVGSSDSPRMSRRPASHARTR